MNKILSKYDNFGYKILCFSIATFLAAFIYNLVFVRYNVVVGGLTGLAVIFKNLFNLNTSLFIGVGNIILIIIGYIYLGKGIINHIVGAVLFSFMVFITAPIANMITYNMSYKLLVLSLAAVFYGAMCGLIFRSGFSCGGMDILEEIISLKSKKPVTDLGIISDGTIILLGTFVLGPASTLYAGMIAFISYKMTHNVMFGVSTKKLVFVISKKNKDIEDYIMNDINTGATEINVKSGLFDKKKQMLFCVIHNTQYNAFRYNILSMDSDAFILANNCYEVNGGYRYRILPF